MDARRARILAGTVFLVGLLATASAGSAAAADCALNAPTYVNVGSALTIQGSGFPASADVDVSFTLDGSPSDSFTVQSTAAGTLDIALTPEDADIGLTTVAAAAGSVCTATATYSVLAAGQTAPTSAGPAASTAPTAPRTDTVGVTAPTVVPGIPGVALALALLAVGVSGLLVTRSARRP